MNTQKNLVLLLCLIVVNIGKSQNVKVEISNGIQDTSIKQTIEKNASTLLTAINHANRSNENSVNFTEISITPDAQKSIAMLWEASPFYCEDRTIIEPLIFTLNGGYQIRNIPLEFTPSNLVAEDETHQEAAIDFDKYGKIEGFNLTIDNNQYKNIVAEGVRLGDYDKRRMILDYVEQFRTAYNKKDIDYLEKVYSDDALIITGRVIKTKKSVPENKKNENKSAVVKITQSRNQYLSRLKRIFNNSQWVNVSIDELGIIRHPIRKNYYGVSFRLKYNANSYSDDGYLFLLWDFTNENKPQIHLKVWEEPNNFINGIHKFSILDFKM